MPSFLCRCRGRQALHIRVTSPSKRCQRDASNSIANKIKEVPKRCSRFFVDVGVVKPYIFECPRLLRGASSSIAIKNEEVPKRCPRSFVHVGIVKSYISK